MFAISKNLKRYPLILFLLLTFVATTNLEVGHTQEPTGTTATITPNKTEKSGAIPALDSSEKSPNLLTMLSVLAGLALLPFAVMLLTSFVKIVIVLSLL